MQKLLTEDWLPRAQKLFVGQSVRVQHRNEHRQNLVITNDKGTWWAYCHACHASASVVKAHVILGADPIVETPDQTRPTDLVLAASSEFGEIVGAYLASKGMDYVYLPDVYLSTQSKRILIQDDLLAWHGRDLTGKSNFKWMNYNKAKFVGVPTDCTIVTEDLFSMYKMRYALKNFEGVSVCCTLGASISQAAALALKDCKTIIYAYDADKAGDDGFIQGRKRMRPFGATQLRYKPPEGLDPKDMECHDIRQLLKEVLNEDL